MWFSTTEITVSKAVLSMVLIFLKVLETMMWFQTENWMEILLTSVGILELKSEPKVVLGISRWNSLIKIMLFEMQIQKSTTHRDNALAMQNLTISISLEI
ncbi:hypothetical protein D3C86_1328510 [compost metagenome]